MESLSGVDRLMMNGVRATLVLEAGATLTEGAVRIALGAQDLELSSFGQQLVEHPGAVYVAETPGST